MVSSFLWEEIHLSLKELVPVNLLVFKRSNLQFIIDGEQFIESCYKVITVIYFLLGYPPAIFSA